ncbi:MAG: hypothetical protein HFH09_03515 [Bacilli bacterium]|nr:hypothetical protein [Bacilli bacterium]
MNFKNKDMFGNQVFRKQVNLNQNPSLQNSVSNLKAMSVDPTKKNEVLSSLNRFQKQMSSNDYNEILSNVKSLKSEKVIGENSPLESKKEINEQDYQRTISDLKRLEHEVRFK